MLGARCRLLSMQDIAILVKHLTGSRQIIDILQGHVLSYAGICLKFVKKVMLIYHLIYSLAYFQLHISVYKEQLIYYAVKSSKMAVVRHSKATCTGTWARSETKISVKTTEILECTNKGKRYVD